MRSVISSILPIVFLLFIVTPPILAHDPVISATDTCPSGHTEEAVIGDPSQKLCRHPGGGSGTTPPANISLPAEPAERTITSSTGLPGQIVTKFLPAVIIILGFLSLFYIIFAGIRFIISKGDPEKVAEARSRLTYAIVGFIILLLAFALTQLIDRLFLNSGAI